MPWNDKNYPNRFGALPEEIRKRALDIAKVLVDEEGFDETRAVEEAIQRARKWDSKSRGRLESSSD